LWSQAKARYGASENVSFLHGSSSDKLRELATTLDSATLFWLDAHWSRGNTFGATKECPLLEELEVNYNGGVTTTTVLNRIARVLKDQQLSLRDLCRTFMFLPSTDLRPGYGEARKEVYKNIFAEDEFPPNSGIYVQDLGQDILLRSVAIAYDGKQTIVASPKVRKAPGSFSQSVRVGDWLLQAGQDAVGFNRIVEGEGDLAGQTKITLQHVKDIVDEAGGAAVEAAPTLQADPEPALRVTADLVVEGTPPATAGTHARTEHADEVPQRVHACTHRTLLLSSRPLVG